MEKDYKVRFYYFGEGPDRILTTTQLLELAGKITERTPFTDLSGAIEVVARYFSIPTYQVLKQNYKEERKFYSTFEVETSTQKSTIDSILSKPTYEQPNALIFTYDGYKENDFITMLGLAGCTYSVKLERIKYSEGQLRILDLKRIFELVNHAQQVIKDKDTPFVLLIDSVDSGLSPDFAIKIQQMIHQFVNHNASSNLRILLVSNTYEFFQNWDEDKTDIIDAQTFEKVHFSSYEDYVTYCQERTSYEGRIVGTNIYRD